MLFHLVSVFRLFFFLRSFCRPGYCLKHLNPLMFMCVANTARGTFNMQKVFFKVLTL